MLKNNTIYKSIFFPILRHFPYLLFFLILFTYFYFFINYIFFFQEKSSFFITGWSFFVNHLNSPGNFLIYLGKFFSAFYYYPLIGSLIISSFIIAIVFVTAQIIKFKTGNTGFVIPFLAGGILFYLHTHYHYLIYNTIGIFFQVLAFYLIIKFIKKDYKWLIIIFTPGWFFLTGSFAWLLFIMLSFTILQKPAKSDWIIIIGMWSICFLFLYLSEEYFFFQPFSKLIIFPFLILNAGNQFLLFIFLIILICILLPFIKLCRNIFSSGKFESKLNKPLTAIIIILLALIPCIKRVDKNLKHYFHTEKLFYQNKMDEIIAFNKRHPSNNRLTSYFVNIALCETGKLNDMLFHFPQSIENNTLFLEWERIGEILKRGGYFYYTIGIINEAHRWNFEYMVMEGFTPQGIKMLIKTELINGNFEIAAKYISLLKHSLFYRKEASEFEKLLFDDMAIDLHPELGEKRRNKIMEDFIIDLQNPLFNLENALNYDWPNKQAFEYKLAFLLLTKDFSAIINDMHNLKKFGFDFIPIHIQEALCVYQAFSGSKTDFSGSQNITKEIRTNFQNLNKTLNQYGNNIDAARMALQKEIQNTFWYYFLYN